MRKFAISCALGALALTGCNQDSAVDATALEALVLPLNVESVAWPGCPPGWTVPPDPAWGLPDTYGESTTFAAHQD